MNMKDILLTLLLLGCIVITSSAQSVDLKQRVSVDFENVRLEDAIKDISEEYKVLFSYSKYYIPVDERVSLQVIRKPLSYTLDRLFENVNVEYICIGDQIVLKKGKKKEEDDFFMNESEPLFGSNDQPARAITPPAEIEYVTSTRPYEPVDEVPFLEKYNYGLPQELTVSSEPEIELDEYYLAPPPEEDEKIRAQVSLVPFVGTNMESASDKTNNVSLNVLGGENGGVNGVEVGGLFNMVENDVNGVQVAGLFNKVKGDVGSSAYITGNSKRAKGVQVAGLVNIANDVNAVQVAGLTNVNSGLMNGIQVGGLGNFNGNDASGIQIGGLFNINRGGGGVQLAGLTNIADDVDGLQISGVFNKARDVDGMQFALINIADTVSGVSIGLLNFVRRGYNQLEVAGGESMHAQMALRLGTKRWYNIFQFAAKVDGVNAWSLGYGIGTTVDSNPFDKWQANHELVVSQIFEDGRKFENMNLRFEYRWLAELKMSRRASFFIGPVFNLMLIDLYESEGQIVRIEETEIPLYTIYDNETSTKSSTDLKAWVGLRMGFRFGRN